MHGNCFDKDFRSGRERTIFHAAREAIVCWLARFYQGLHDGPSKVSPPRAVAASAQGLRAPVVV